MMLSTIAAIGFGVAAGANLLAMIFRDTLGFGQIPRWQFALAAGLFGTLTLLRAITAAAG